MRILSWNILQGGGKRSESIASEIIRLSPDILTLQEFRHNRSSAIILGALDQVGLTHRLAGVPESKKNSVFVASRQPIELQPLAADLDPSNAMKVNVRPTDSDFCLIALHLPHKRAQIPYFETLLDSSDLTEQASMVIGDLNCGIPFEDSEVKTFANTHLFQLLLKRGWTDAWRQRHLSAAQFSWISAKGNGYRYDHCLCSDAMNSRILAIEYEHRLREEGLSDHSALVVDCQ